MMSSSTDKRYSHHEVLSITPHGVAASSKIGVDVTIEATSSITLPFGAFATTGEAAAVAAAAGTTCTSTGTGACSTGEGTCDNSDHYQTKIPATPFPSHVVDLVTAHRLKRLRVQVGSSSSSSSSPLLYAVSSSASKVETTGPGGSSIIAELYLHSDDARASKDLNDRIQSLLRSLVGSRLICAPLDSISIYKYQHYSYPISYSHEGRSDTAEGNSGLETATYEIVLPAMAGHFCVEGMRSFRQNLLPCRDHSGFLAKSPSSEIMLGLADVNRLGSNRRFWVDIGASGEACYGIDASDECKLSLRHGVLYGAEVEIDATFRAGDNNIENDDENITKKAAWRNTSFALGDVLGGIDTLKSCPLADTSRIITNVVPAARNVEFSLPFQGNQGSPSENGGYEYKLNNYDDGNRVKEAYPVLHDVKALADENGQLDLNRKWITLEMHPVRMDNHFGVDRTVGRPRGIANHGRFRTVYRNGALDAAIVETMDIYPKFVKPLMQSLSIELFQRTGAGDSAFVPSIRDDSIDLLSSRNTHVLEKGGFSLIPNDDGSVSLQLTVSLPPDSSLWISMKYEPRFLSFEHFPSDPNRGIDLLPSYGTFRNATGIDLSSTSMLSADDYSGIRLYTPSTIIMPPVPDMSMPFNVISLSCTLYAFIIGSMVNFLVRKSSQRISDAYKGRKEKSKLAKIKQKLRAKLQRILRRRKRNDKGPTLMDTSDGSAASADPNPDPDADAGTNENTTDNGQTDER